MKKLISILLAVSLFASLAAVFAVPAAAEENLCAYFDEMYFGTRYDDEAEKAKINNGTTVKCDDLSNRCFAVIAIDQYRGDNAEWGQYDPTTGVFTVTDEPESYDMRIPAAEFEELAKKIYPCGDDFVDQFRNGVNDLVIYDSKIDRYICRDYGVGGRSGGIFMFRGYKNADNNTYSVYMQEMVDGAEQYGDEEFVSMVESGELGVGMTVGEYVAIANEKNIITEINLEKSIYWLDSYVKFTVEYDGEYSKVLSVESVDSLPSANEMVTPEYTDSVRYNLYDAIKVDGGDAFPSGTVITVKGIKNYDENNIAGSLKGVAKDGKIQAFEINAMLSGASVQPNGKVKVTIYLADYLTAENLKMYYIAKDGTREEIKITVTGRTVVAELEHFSTYALCNVVESAGSGTANAGKSPKTGDTAAYIYLGIMTASAAAAAFALIVSKKGRKENV